MMRKRKPLLFFVLLVGMAVPMWLTSGWFGVISDLRVPVSDLALAFAPMIVAFGLVAVIEGVGAARSLMMSACNLASIGWTRWTAMVVLVPPLIYGTAFAAMRLLGSAAHPQVFDPARLAALAVLFFGLAIGEEVGWSGYAFGALQQRWGALRASLIIAVPWWLGHLPSMAEVGATAIDMAWWVLGAAGLRIIMGWLFNRTGGSLFAMVTFHALLNLSRIALFPAVGAHYLTAYQAAADLVIGCIALAIVIDTRGRLGFSADRQEKSE